MRLKSKLLGVSLALACSGANAAILDRVETSVEELTFTYYNDVHDDGSYYPNWVINFPKKMERPLDHRLL
ncbi:MAG: hypothetical protein NC097_04745 [Clostridium sp.]|nr:hypothetical protein [Prevotella sp.]MCM1429085.1 hypothetical protein [Clostridium sp.]